MTKQPPTRRQHVELGDRLQDARETVLDAVVMTGTHYAKSSKVATAAAATLKALEHLRHLLDEESHRELQGEQWSPTIYYGANREVRAKWLAEHPLDDE